MESPTPLKAVGFFIYKHTHKRKGPLGPFHHLVICNGRRISQTTSYSNRSPEYIIPELQNLTYRG